MPAQMHTLSPATPAGTGAVTDRRRPGRSDVSPALVPLLRRPAIPGMLESPLSAEAAACAPCGIPEGFFEPEHDLAGARGLGIGLLLAVPLWAAIILGTRALLHLAF